MIVLNVLVSTGGIGRELYTAPFMWVTSNQCTITTTPDGKYTTKDAFSVAHIVIQDKKIVELVIVNDKTNEVVFEWSSEDYNKNIGKDKLDTIKALNVDTEKAKEVLASYGYSSSKEIKVRDFSAIFNKLKEITNEN